MGPDTTPSLASAEPADLATVSIAEQIPPDILPRLIATQASYRYLVTSGLTGAEAAGIIGYVSGLSVGGGRWSLAQVNRLLFLQNLYNRTQWGNLERRPE
jgi:hypothetical protein